MNTRALLTFVVTSILLARGPALVAQDLVGTWWKVNATARIALLAPDDDGVAATDGVGGFTDVTGKPKTLSVKSNAWLRVDVLDTIGDDTFGYEVTMYVETPDGLVASQSGSMTVRDGGALTGLFVGLPITEKVDGAIDVIGRIDVATNGRVVAKTSESGGETVFTSAKVVTLANLADVVIGGTPQGHGAARIKAKFVPTAKVPPVVGT